MGILFCALAPFFHDMITIPGEGLRWWVPVLGIEDFLTTTDGKVWGYSTYRVFLYMAGIQLALFLGWFIALHLARNKSYRFVLYFPTLLFGYQFLLVVFNLRATKLNDFNYKIVLIIALGMVLIGNFFFNKQNTENIGH